VDEDSARIVAAGYDSVADRYEALEREEWPRLRRLRKLLELLPEGSAVLDVGCGNGLPSLAAIAERHRATAIDVSAVQADRARRNVPAATVLHGDALEAVFPDASFDAIVSFYAVEHMPRRRHPELFARFFAWLRPNGLLLFTIEAREAHDTVGEWLGEPMFFSQFSPQETLELLRAAGFEVVSTDLESQLEGENEVEYAWVLARRPG
jgi:cyclopropane fatty-acyl-phospholipid synthase-like methyltransferase